MEVDDEVEEEDMDFNPFLREGSPSGTSSSLTSEADCEETSIENQPSSEVYLHDSLGNESTSDCALPQNRSPPEHACNENVPETTPGKVYCENREGHLDGLEKETLPSEASSSATTQNSRQLLVERSEEDAICRRTRARYSLANYALEELETFLQESDDDGDLQNVDEEEEYRKFLAAVLSGVGNETQACQGDENQDEDENDADFELEIEEALESDGDENADNYDDLKVRNEKDGSRPQTRQKRPESSRAGNYRHESTKSTLRPIMPYVSPAPALLAPGQYPSQYVLVPSSLSSVTSGALVNGFTDQQLGQLHMLIYEHVQLMIQTFSLSVLDSSKHRVAADVKKMIIELVRCRDQALARRNTPHQQLCFQSQYLRSSVSLASSESLHYQWMPTIKNPVMSILDVSPLHLALGYLSDVAAAVVKYRRSHVDSAADKSRSRKESLFPSPVLSPSKEANNVSQDRSNSVSVASPVSSGQHKKSLAATLFESSKKESVALVPFDIARLAQRFFSFFNFSLVPHKPPPQAMANRVLFTDAEDGLLALGILEYNNDWGAIQKRFLPCKSEHQIFVRQKNRSSSKALDNPIKEVRRMKVSPLTIEEVQRIQEGLKMFKNDWVSVWRFVVPHRDPSLLQRQWRVATGVQRSYSKNEAAKEKRRSYEAKRRKLRASMPDSRVACEQEADYDASEDVENDDDSYVNEAFLAETENMMPYQLSSSRDAGKGINMQSNTNLYEECGVAGRFIEQHKRNSTRHDTTTSYMPFNSCTSDGLSSKRISAGSSDQLQASQLCKEKGSVVKLAPDLPPVNLPPSVRVISQVSFHQNAPHFNGASDNAARDMYTVPPPTFTESFYRQLNLFPDHSGSVRSQQNVITNGNTTEGVADPDFQMHPLLFQYPREASNPVQSLVDHSRKYDLFPFEKVQLEKSINETTDGIEKETPVNTYTIDFHPLLQRTEVEMHGDEVPEDDRHESINRSECSIREASVDDLSTARLSTSPRERENNIDLDIHLCSSRDLMSAKDFSASCSKSIIQEERALKDKASDSELDAGNACSHHCIKEPSEVALQGIVMEQEELSDSDEDSRHVEFECEEMDDSEEEQVQDIEPCATQTKGIARPIVCREFQGSNDQSQVRQELVQMGKQGASLTQKPQGSSSARSARAKLKSAHAKRGGSRINQRLPTSCTTELSQAKTRKSKTQLGEAGAEHKSSESRRSRKNPAPS